MLAYGHDENVTFIKHKSLQTGPNDLYDDDVHISQGGGTALFVSDAIRNAYTEIQNAIINIQILTSAFSGISELVTNFTRVASHSQSTRGHPISTSSVNWCC